MSETTQEKRQWVGSYRDIQTGDGYLRVVAPDGMVWESAGTINDLPAKDQPVCCQQSELLLAINTLPKMREFVTMMESYHKRILKDPTDVDSHPTANDLFSLGRLLGASLEEKR